MNTYKYIILVIAIILGILFAIKFRKQKNSFMFATGFILLGIDRLLIIWVNITPFRLILNIAGALLLFCPFYSDTKAVIESISKKGKKKIDYRANTKRYKKD